MKFARSDKIYFFAVITTIVSILFLIFIIFSTWMNLKVNRKNALIFYNESTETILKFIKEFSHNKKITPDELFNTCKKIMSGKEKDSYILILNKGEKTLYSTCNSKSNLIIKPEPVNESGIKKLGDKFFYQNYIRIESPEKENLYLILGIEMKKYNKALKADIKHSLIMVSMIAFLSAGSLFFLFVIRSYRNVNIMLNQAGNYTRKVVENMANGLITIDSSGKIISFNQAGLNLLGIDEDSNLFNLDICNTKILNRTIKYGKSVSEHEHLICTPTGEKNLSISITPIDEKNSNRFGAVIIIRDLTEIKRLEREIRRTEKLAAVGRLAAMVAHEIRNPLSSIRGFGMLFANILKEDEKKKGYAMLIVNEVDRINRVVTDLLTYSKKLDINPVKINPFLVFDHALNLLNLEMEKKKIELIKELKDEMPFVMVDPERMNQVLLNLMINSIELMEEGGKIEVGAKFMEEMNRVKFWISDTGPGIETGKQKEIFDLFYTTREKGTGLGLAIVQKIVEYHDGTIEVESPVKDNRGTKFTIYLPSGLKNRLDQGD